MPSDEHLDKSEIRERELELALIVMIDALRYVHVYADEPPLSVVRTAFDVADKVLPGWLGRRQDAREFVRVLLSKVPR